MDHTAAATLLARLEADHGIEVLAALLGASFRRDLDSLLDECPDADEQEPIPNGEFAYDWCAAFCEHPAFWAAADLDA